MKKIRIIVFFIFIMLMESCSLTNLAWNNATWLVMYELDHYFDLSWDEQKAWRPRIATLVKRLQGQAGPELVLFLQESRGTLLDGLTEEKVASLFDEWDALRVRHLSPLTSDAAEYLAALDESNVTYLRKHLSDSQKREEKVLSLSDEQYEKNRAARARQRVEQFYGRITAAQAKAAVSILGQSRQDQRDHLAQRKDTQKSFLAMLGGALTRDEIKSRLDQWVKDPASMRTTKRGRLSYWDERRLLIRNIVAIDRLMSPRQRNYFAGKLAGWKEDLLDSLQDKTAIRLRDASSHRP